MITQKELKYNLMYNPWAGLFYWKINKKKHKPLIGTVAGYIDSNGYRIIGINRKQYRANRLVWLYVYGYFSEYEIDHKDQIKHNDRFNNLREATPQCNRRNCGNLKNNTSGVKGVSYVAPRKLWNAHIKINKIMFNLGNHRDFDEAVYHRLAAEQCLDWQKCESASPAHVYVKNLMEGVI